MTSYIYNDVEVKLTGRTATKPQKERRSSTNNPKQLLEITNIDQTIEIWKKWVAVEEMYIIDETNND